MRYVLFTCFAFILTTVSFSVIAQKTGRNYRLIADKYKDNQARDSSILYYDSAFHQYTRQNHYASATLAYLPIAEYLLDSGQVDSTHYYMRFVFDSTKNLSRYALNDVILNLKKSLVEYYFERNMFDSTQSVLNETLDLCIKKYGRRAEQNTRLYSIQSLLYFYSGDIALASLWMKNALDANKETANMGEMWVTYLEYNVLIENEEVLNELQVSTKSFPEKETIRLIYSALDTFRKGHLEKSIEEFGEIDFVIDSTTSQAVVLKYNYLKSLLLLEKGEFDQSLAVAKEYLLIAQSTYPESHPISAGYYQQVCRVYNEKSDYGAARGFIEKLIYGMEKELGNGHPLKAEAYFEYARLLSQLENYEQAHHQVDTAIVISQANAKSEGIFLGRCYNQKGIVNFHLNELDSAEVYLQQSLKILDENLDNKQHIYIAKVFNDLGRVYQYMEVDEQSISDYVRSLKIYNVLLGKVHPHLGTGYYNVGSLYAKNQNYRKALEYYQISLISNVFDFEDTSIYENPKLDNVMSDIILLKSLTGKVEALELYYEQTKDLNSLFVSLSTYNLIADLIDKLRTGYVSEESKRFLSEKTSYLYERAIRLCISLSRISGDDVYLESAFFFSEKSRAGILLAGIKDANAKKVAGVPDSLLVREKLLVQQVSDKEVELFDELSKGTRARANIVQTFQDELFNLKNQYSDFIVFLENEYLSYYKLKYDSYSASVKDIQTTILNPINKRDKKEYNMLEYFIGKDSLYVFHITKESYHLFVKEKPMGFDAMVKGLRNSVIYNTDQYFLDISKKLYDVLIPITLEKKMHLMIIPDGILSYLPFESLLVESSEKSLRKQAYLIKKASVSYSYSATLSVEMAKNPYNYETQHSSFTGFAPVFNEDQQFKVLSSEDSLAQEPLVGDSTTVLTNHDFKALTGSEEELEAIFKKMKSRKFESNAYFFNSASKQNLLNKSSLDSRFLHFATHGVLDERNPDFSGIVLSDTVGTETLTLGEIYGFNTKAEVVTLSACETGLGQLLGGEGLVSFSRGFFFAGSKFIIVSLWKVGDESSADMSIQFYKKYAKKKRKDIYKNFQKARLKIIAKKKYDNLSDWFPFVIVGMH